MNKNSTKGHAHAADSNLMKSTKGKPRRGWKGPECENVGGGHRSYARVVVTPMMYEASMEILGETNVRVTNR